MIDVAGNWDRVCRQARDAAARAGRDPHSVCVIAVSKTHPVELIEHALAAGATDVGENYVQEAAEKRRRISTPARWHLVGHLQRNKAGRAVELFDVIHTLDGVAVADALARHGERRGRRVRVLLEINVGNEPTKRGVPPAAAASLLATLAERQWLEIDGLMAIPPPGAAAEASRPYFRALRALRDRLRPQAPANAPLRELSMGMSEDFTVAIEEGATMVRVGRAIFGPRPAA